MGAAPTWLLRSVGAVVAPFRLAGLCGKASTWRAVRDTSETLARVWRGGITVNTSFESGDPGSTEIGPVALRSLIQLDGDVLLMVDRAWLADMEKQAPAKLPQMLEIHQARINETLAPLRQGIGTATQLVELASQSRWLILGSWGTCQVGAIAIAPDFDPLAWSHLEVAILQSLSLLLLIVFGLIRLTLGWWVQRRISGEFPALMERLTREEQGAASSVAS